MWRSMGCPGNFVLVEAGAGDGRLACDIMDFLAEQQPDCYRKVSMVLVEQEPSLVAVQANLLTSHSGKLSWLTPDKLQQFRFSGVMYSNELLDAMPVHRVLMTEQGLKEIYVTSASENQFQDIVDTPSTPELDEYLKRFGIPLHPGQEAEVSLAALAWFESAVYCLQKGFILTVDYGWVKSALYAPERSLGTLLCYYRHTVEDNPYSRVGQQDITTHVNFSALIERGEELGVKTLWFGEQSRFLMSAGIIKELEEIELSELPEKEKLRLRLVIKRLIMPNGGMGDTFRVLVQVKGVPEPELGCTGGIKL